MFIIWGTRVISKIFGQPVTLFCPHCNNTSQWQLIKRTNWFTLFFIPLIPFSSKYSLTCPICQASKSLEKHEFEDLKIQSEQSTLPQ